MAKSDNFLNDINPFNRDFYNESNDFTYIGNGNLGGKASGLAKIRNKLTSFGNEEKGLQFKINIPRTVVITTQYFDEFLEQNDLYKIALSDLSNERIAHHFLNAELSVRLSGDLRGLIEKMKLPLAIRSSSLLEDSLNIPLAGVYETKMIPNNHSDPDMRFKKLVEAIKFVYSSTFFANAKTYLRSTGKEIKSEKMGVIIQEVVGRKYYERFYPTISGVAKSYNFYTSGHAVPEDGTVSLALGLGKAIVDGGNSWNYCPVYPDAPPPFNSANDLLKQSQTEFWAVNMGEIKTYDPVKETEYLVKSSINDAEYDNTLSKIASTYNYESDRFDMGVANKGARLINFAPLLQAGLLPLNEIIKSVLKLSELIFRSDVEIEFAVTLGNTISDIHRFSLLQVRPMATFSNPIDIKKENWNSETVLTAGDKILGNGEKDNIKDVIYVIPDTFQLKNTRAIASEIASVNRMLVNKNKTYALIGFGRWGSSDSWLGIPVDWGEISGADVIIESSLPGVFVEMSQGSHFFHNISNLGIFYFSISTKSQIPIDWNWLGRQKIVWEGKHIRHIKLKTPMKIRVDGRKSEGVIFK